MVSEFVAVVVNRSSVGKWFAQSRAVAYLIPGVCILLLAILVTVSCSVLAVLYMVYFLQSVLTHLNVL